MALIIFNDISATTGLVPNGIQCVCAGDRLIYSCNVVGGGSTVWSGTAFDCPSTSSEITLRHSQYASNQAFGMCNNGDIEGQGLEVTNNCYTSQLNVTVREGLNNKTVQCIQNSNQGTRQIGQSTLSVTSGMHVILILIMCPKYAINCYSGKSLSPSC